MELCSKKSLLFSLVVTNRPAVSIQYSSYFVLPRNTDVDHLNSTNIARD